MGYEYFHPTGVSMLVDQDRLRLLAQCQRYYCLAHASFISGVLLFMDYSSKKKYRIETQKLANLLMLFAIIIFPVSIIFLKYPGLTQFY
jgi:hypothetical protein